MNNSNNVINKKKSTMCLTFKVCISSNLSAVLDVLYNESSIAVNEMLKDRTKSSSKYYNNIPCVVAKSLITKYQKNKKCKEVHNLVIPMSYSYNVSIIPQYPIKSYLGVDRNSVGNVATIADTSTGKVLKLGIDTAGLTKNFRNRRSKLQKKGAKRALVKIKYKQSRRIKDVNHKVSRAIVDYAKLHCSAIVLEDLGKISKKGKAKRYVQKSQWTFYQLETFIKYKAALLGVPIFYISPRYTSRICSKCGSLNIANGKNYSCSSCGHFEHRDANAAFNISAIACCLYGKTEVDRDTTVGLIGNPLNQRLIKAGQLESSGGAG